MKNKTCSNLSASSIDYNCITLQNQIKTLKIYDNLVYINDIIYANLISFKDNEIKVEVDNGNRYMKGQIVNILVDITNVK